MINRVKRIFGRPRVSASVDAYFDSVQRPGTYGGPTFEEAQKDFRQIHGKFAIRS